MILLTHIIVFMQFTMGLLVAAGVSPTSIVTAQTNPPYDPAALRATMQALNQLPTSPQSVPASQFGGVLIQGTLSIGGAVTASGGYTLELDNINGVRPDLTSCTAFAQGQHTTDGTTGFRLPDPGSASTFGGHIILAPVQIVPYAGPGMYGRNQGILLGPGVIVDDTSYSDADPSQDYSVVVNPDGSGTFTFTNLHSQIGNAAPYTTPAASGSLSWTCSQAQ